MGILLAKTVFTSSHPVPVCRQNQICLLRGLFAGELDLLLLLYDYLLIKKTFLQLALLDLHRKSCFKSRHQGKREKTQPCRGRGRV